MVDVVYLLTTIAFFALMVAYVAACARLGRAADAERDGHEGPERP